MWIFLFFIKFISLKYAIHQTKYLRHFLIINSRLAQQPRYETTFTFYCSLNEPDIQELGTGEVNFFN